MSMSIQANATAARAARWLLGCAVRHWPAETRPWGLALAAEIDETASAREALRWSLGGLTVFARSILSGVWTWLKLPAGGSLPGGAEGPDGPPLLPKRSRALTAAIVGAAALLLFLPEGREAIRTVRASWQGYEQAGWDARTLKNLAARAEKDNDAGALGFVALNTADSGQAATLTERAVALDPNLIWVYGVINHYAKDNPRRTDWQSRLQAADPGNAVAYLLLADALVEPRIHMLDEHGAPEQTVIRVLESDPAWVALMERAYRAPRYDSYVLKYYQLAHSMWNREGYVSPSAALYGSWYRAVPDLRNIRIYFKIKMREPKGARATGDLKRAETLLSEMDAFGMRMANSGGEQIEQIIGLMFAKHAQRELAGIYSGTGNAEDQRRVALRVEQVEGRVQGMQPWRDPANQARMARFRKEAILVQCFGTLVAIAGVAAFAAILLLELWPRKIRDAKRILRRAACWTADNAPTMLLAASGGFILSFLPFQRAFAEYRASNDVLTRHQRLTEALLGLEQIPDYMLGVYGHLAIWSVVTIALTALLIFVVTRGIYRTIES
jgi:hypothetical protein